MLRFVVDPVGRLTEDLNGKLPGRGIHVLPTRANITALLKRRGLFAKLLAPGVELQTPTAEELLTRLETALLRRLSDGVGLAKRAGALRLGLRELEEALTASSPTQPVLTLLAADTARHTREKWLRLVRHWPQSIRLEASDRLTVGAACGRAEVAVIAVIGAGPARRIEADVTRWILFSGVGAVLDDEAVEAALQAPRSEASLPETD
ncbi:putative 50S ribosomal protein L7AE [Magnetofaba australis IT-1]|uniref:Putative 50S ribosomal protein L7AE n=1 Tax=Magnetofaba australis IT-1 TaxID=1434232 RepID=A0A1Y2K208_9PROT|nr:putative 50S ribosomal protein L7AE [Magnetofaba australis IT-1]